MNEVARLEVLRTELLALIEGEPAATQQLAAWVNQPSDVVKRILRALFQEGQIKRIGTAGGDRWVSAEYVGPRLAKMARRPPVKLQGANQPATKACESCGDPYKPKGPQKLCAACRSKRQGGYVIRPRMTRDERKRLEADALTNARLGIEEPTSGIAFCGGCGTRFVPETRWDQPVPEFCSDRCRQEWRGNRPRTIVVNGKEFEATSVGAHSFGRGEV